MEAVLVPVEKIVRDPGFAKRLEQACDANFHCPPQHHGRLRWLADELKTRFNETVSQETIRKWIRGEVKPRGGKHELLAQILGVDPTWLYLGVDSGMSPRERKVRNAEADGVINLVAGLIQMDGGFPAFPQDNDKRAADNHIDLYAIIRGASYAFHVSLARQKGGDYEFSVPVAEGIVVLGIVREGFTARIVELTPELVQERGHNSGGSALVTLTAAEFEVRQVSSFADRL